MTFFSNFYKVLQDNLFFVFQSDIVCTFFHPLLRDEQEAQKENLGVQKFRGILFYILILVFKKKNLAIHLF
jgi:hypothetical protein